MKRKVIQNVVAAAALVLALPAHATIILNDTWADGSRNQQNLPDESRWFAANRATNLVATVGSMTFLTDSTGSRAALTYFAPSGSPVTIADGETLRVSAVFTPSGVAAGNANESMRFGLVDYSNGTRLTGDGTSSGMNGAGVAGYALFVNFVETFGTAPMRILERTDLTNADLLGAGAAWTSLGAGGGTSGDPGFVSGVQYTLTFSVTRDGDVANVLTRFVGGDLDITQSVTDTSGHFSFDGFAMRNSRGDQTAASFQFTEFTVELIPVPEPSTCALLGLSLAGFFATRLRRARK